MNNQGGRINSPFRTRKLYNVNPGGDAPKVHLKFREVRFRRCFKHNDLAQGINDPDLIYIRLGSFEPKGPFSGIRINEKIIPAALGPADDVPPSHPAILARIHHMA
jgi:hypothetical protein